MKDAKGHGSDPKGMSIDEMIATSGEYKASTLKNDPSYYPTPPAPAHQTGVEAALTPPTHSWSGVTDPLDPAHQHFDVYVDHGYGTRRMGNDPYTTLGAKSLSEARAAWKQIGSPSQTSNFRLERRRK
jgi:hypothetical protein